MTERLARNAELARFPCAGSDKDTAVAVIQQILYACRSAESKVRAEQNAHIAHSAIVAVQNGLGQTEFRDTVAEDSSDFFAAFEYRDFVSSSCQNNGNRDTGRACTDNADFHAVRRSTAQVKSLKTGVGDIIFNR